MVRVFMRWLTCLGATILLVFATYFPFWGIYDFTLETRTGELIGTIMGAPMMDANLFRTRVTIAAVLIAVILSLGLFLLGKACKKLELDLFGKMLGAALYYVPIMTFVMLTGMWLDLEAVLTSGPHDDASGYVRVGYIFYCIFI